MEVRSPLNIPAAIHPRLQPPKNYTLFVRPEVDSGICGDVLLNAQEILGTLCRYSDPIELILHTVTKANSRVSLEISVPMPRDLAETKLDQLLPMQHHPRLYCGCGNRMIFSMAALDD